MVRIVKDSVWIPNTRTVDTYRDVTFVNKRVQENLTEKEENNKKNIYQRGKETIEEIENEPSGK